MNNETALKEITRVDGETLAALITALSHLSECISTDVLESEDRITSDVVRHVAVSVAQLATAFSHARYQTRFSLDDPLFAFATAAVSYAVGDCDRDAMRAAATAAGVTD